MFHKGRQLEEQEGQLDIGDGGALGADGAPGTDGALDTEGRGAPAETPVDPTGNPMRTERHASSSSMLPERRERPPLESAFVRAVATGGVLGIGVALGAILVSQNVAGWIVGLVVALVSVTLSAILWSSRRL